ncbi:similar to Saccharomyces cerevisiae YLR369W SSQ1 Mitochondrial hsp70-type molecular chaperone [Maudiozyma barnettii]|uniref:non-chaperonin molecular chaperone ATPase n=1 Tax=Maudiozyma barnettii TaxID=61262 RepID=A0A8H2VL03_9SACH|nr:Hsp70 family ATPase SSQ1 [Kazachstania barnettii]CAB4257278.1 similar to Saccharomyces cerevisiae YLR369W SSQ1 Mitochondrial hsp70-type molecular chaperone [Kazachstania barnettii]CAD1784543.1 similar to Saccharomyces cerevisiae YLR369W SSQ1 Mitochondrial hsp70-type molecular chaperone [Kazachstania barnettii]
MLRSSMKSSSFPRVLRRLASTKSSKVIGIDLGTTNSAVAYIRDVKDKKSATIIENDQGQRTTPSIVSYTVNPTSNKIEKVLVGLQAKRQQMINPENTFFATKRLIGRSFNDEEVQRDMKRVPFKIMKGSTNGDDVSLKISNGESKSPKDIGAAILTYLKTTADSYLNEHIDKAVITVPAYFNDSQRQATKEAGKLAGLNVLRVVNEPTAAALSFGLDDKMKNGERKNGLLAVYDLGGGTFDISILDIEDGVFEVRSTNGDTHLGGEDFDNIIVDYLLKQFISQNGDEQKLSLQTLQQNRALMQRLRDAAENVKIQLSHVKTATVDIPFLCNNLHLHLEMKEEELDNMTLHLINKTIPPVKKALRDADIETEDIDEVIMVGGMTRMPKIRKTVEDLFNKKPNTSVNPDETVAIGAAIQGGIISGEIKDVLLLDVTPLTLGIETIGGAFSPLIPRNTTVPVKKTEIFSTGVDNQTGVEIKVYQGERGLVRNNKLIGNFQLAGIPPMPKGMPQIAVTFDIDADGIINVSAAEKSSGQAKSITVVANQSLTEKEINKLVEEANENRDSDNTIRKRLELITKADIMVSDSEAAFEKYKDTISGDSQYGEVLNELQALRVMIDTFKKEANDTKLDVNVIKRSTDTLQNKAFKLFQRVTASQKEAQNN